jgi:hypothetical protein
VTVDTETGRHAAEKLYEILAGVERGDIRADTPAERALLERIEVVLALYEERMGDVARVS